MNRIGAVFFVGTMLLNGQSFQPPAWGQGQNSVQSQNSIQQQISQLQEQIQKLRSQQREMSRPHVEMQSGMVTGHPLSGKEVRSSRQTLSDGTSVSHSDTSYFYRDGEGRMRAEGPNGVEIFDPVAHFAYDINPATKSYRRSSLSGNVLYVSIAAYANSTESHIRSGDSEVDSPAQKQNQSTEDLGRHFVNGLMARGARVTITIPAGTIGNDREIRVVNERWYSEDLQILLKSINTDPRFGVNEYELIELRQGNPDASLFKPPADYAMTAHPWER